ncbi:DUF2264 domain-containing protein [Halobacillus salinarum]|uniref:DUF2264 domain-containing protein n=1 Tax=Halobacillus salinarum TaxID=2932257 RepID=A0ABY4EKL7_9BACI|nr:DUF2264 domain-containing protein [Halobacillus salinarum]UOQ44174.1 DUF2264 domain-containing protein [Halobacillus salinarum]
MNEERTEWLSMMLKIADPVLHALKEQKLKKVMPVEMIEGTNREDFTYLEALARLLVGMAPWLEASVERNEEELRLSYCHLAREAIDAATDSDSEDFMNFTEGGQTLVDTAFLAQALLRAPDELWQKLESRVKDNVIHALKETRAKKPVFSNWLLFSAIIEAALFKVGEADWDRMRIDYALKQFDHWYLGDGIYSDGPAFHYDAYNSFVIHPMLLDLIETIGSEYPDWEEEKRKIQGRSKRYAAIQERLISPDGTFPPVGRSIAYRCGAFQSLARHAWKDDLPEELAPAQVRSALTAVIRKSLGAPGTFTHDNWLTIGFSGHQPGIGERYISTGSVYLCTAVFLPLGLPYYHEFWTGDNMDWTAKKAWGGQAFQIDKAWKEEQVYD